MNKLLAFATAVLLSTGANAITPQEYSQSFKHFNGCFILYNLNKQKIVSEYNPGNRCSERLAPDSTFKIPISLMAFNQGIINQNTLFKWDGQKGELPDWNRDQTQAAGLNIPLFGCLNN